MGISDKMQMFADSTKATAKNASLSLLQIFLRVTTGFFLGLTLALIFQELLGFGTFSLIFFVVVTMALVFRTLSAWSIGKILILDLFLVLVAMLLRMYILVAP